MSGGRIRTHNSHTTFRDSGNHAMPLPYETENVVNEVDRINLENRYNHNSHTDFNATKILMNTNQLAMLSVRLITAVF